ncbi:MAG: aminopeptidase P family protein [Lachnospiraceae bacterium]|nr:aminopeptidase P family protein [Lachnospiraceae bacterium]
MQTKQTGKEKIKERIQQLREIMKREKVDVYFVPTADFHHSEYVHDYFKVREFLSGFTGSNGDLVVTKEEALLWTDGRYFIQAEKELAGTNIQLCKMFEEGVPGVEEYLQQHMKKGETLAFDGRCVTLAYGDWLNSMLKEKEITLSFEKDMVDEIWKERPRFPCNPVFALDSKTAGETVEEKLKKLRTELKKHKVWSVVLGKLDDIMWLYNIRGNDIECNPVAVSYSIVTDTEAMLFLQKGTIGQQVTEHLERAGVRIEDYQSFFSFLSEWSIEQRGETEKKALVERGEISLYVAGILMKNEMVLEGGNPVSMLKAGKSPKEIANLKEIFRKDSAAVIRFIYWLKKNIGKIPMNELSAANYLDGLRKEIPEFLELSFPTISAYKENAAMMHYQAVEASAKPLRAEGMLLVDSGGQYFGGTTDVTRTIFLGDVKKEIKKQFTMVAVSMLNLANARFLHGCTGRNLDILAREPLWEMGLDYKCGTGHGVGYMLNVHEGPQRISWQYREGVKETVFEEGMLITDEPGVYVEGSHGIRTENVLLCKKAEKNSDGQFMEFEALTFVPIDLEGILPELLSEKEKERLNRYHELVYEKTKEFLTEEEKAWLYQATRPL